MNRVAFVVISAVVVGWVSSAHGQTNYYWDTNGATSGFGTASGTWGGSSFFSTNASGTVATTNVTTTTNDTLNFSSNSTALATGTIAVSGSQSIGYLVFGAAATPTTLSGGTIGLRSDSNLHANNIITIDSLLAGASTNLQKNGGGTAIFTQANTYSGSTSVIAGTLTLGGANGSILSSSAITVTGATLTLDNATSNNNDRIANGVSLGAGAAFSLTGNASVDTTEAFGTLAGTAGANTVTVTQANAGRIASLSGTAFSRASNATGLVRGSNLGISTAAGASRVTFTDLSGLSFVGATTMNNGSDSSSKTVRVIPYFTGDTNVAGNGASFLTYDTTLGLRALDTTNQYTTLSAAYTTAATAENVNAFNGTITTAGPTVNSLRFGTASQTLNGSGALTINSGAILAAANTTAIGSGFSSVSLGDGTWNEGVIHVASGNTFTVNAPISVTGGGGLTKGLTGNLTLNAANTYTGDTVVNAGNLTLGASGLLAGGNYAGAVRAVAGAVTLTNTASQSLTGGLSSAGLLTLNAPGAISISGGLTTSAGLTVGANAGSMSISGSWTSSGNVTVPTGKEVSFANGTVAATASVVNITGGGAFTFESGTLNAANNQQNVITNNSTFNQGGGRVSFINGSAATVNALRIGSGNSANYTITGGTLDTSANSGAIVVAYNQGATVLSSTFTINGSTALVTARNGSAGGALIVGWSGLGGGGTVNLSQGEIQLASLGTYNSNEGLAVVNLGGPSGSMTIRPYSGNLSLSGGVNTTYTLTGNNAVIASSDQNGTARTVTVSRPLGESGGRRGIEFSGLGTTTLNAANTYSGTTQLTSGTLALGNQDALQNSTLNVGGVVTFTVAGTGTYAFGGLAGSTGLAIGGNTLRIGSNNDTTTYGGVVSGASGAIVKTGSGSLALTAVQNFAGSTSILGGRLDIGGAGSINASSGIVIDGGELRYNSATALTKPITFTAGTISGTGTIGTAVTVATGDFVSPGNSPGTQAYTSLHAWSPGGTYVWELNALTGTPGTNWDFLNVTSGTFDFSGLAATPGSRFVLDLVTLDASNAAGPLASPFDGGSFTFSIVSYNASNVLLPTGFANTAGTDLTGLFQINLNNWQGTKPELGNISVKVNSTATGIDLVIVPEPATLVLLAAGAAVAAAVRSKRRRSCTPGGA